MKFLQQCVLLGVVAVCASVLGWSPAYAAGTVPVTGDMATDTVWTADDGVYVVSSVVTIDPGATLYIEPGTIVKFSQGASLNVLGALNAAGNPVNPVYFTSFADDAVGGDTNADGSNSLPSASDTWDINFLHASYSTISGAVLRYSSGGIFNLDSRLSLASTSVAFMDNPISVSQGKLNLSNVLFSHMSQGALWIYATSSATLASTTVTNSTTGAVMVYNNSNLSARQLSVVGEQNGPALSVYNLSTATCERCALSDNATSVVVYSGSNLALNHSSIENATGTAATDFELYDPAWNTSLPRHSQATLSATTLRGGKDGIIVFGPVTLRLATTTIENFSDDGIQAYDGATLVGSSLRVSKNKNAGLEMWSTVNGSVRYSDISDNGQFGILSRTATPFAAVQNWWGSASGPHHATLNTNGSGDTVSDNVTFSPWLQDKTPPDPVDPPPCCSSVLFIPGIEASRLYATSSTLLGRLTKRAGTKEIQLWEPGFTTPINKLMLDESGASLNSVYTKDIITTTNELLPMSNIDIYKTFSGVLTTLATEGAIASWQAYPYDWRLDPQSLVENGTQLAATLSRLEPMVESLAASSKTGKVTIVAHSNGGILAKLLLSKLQAEGKSQLVDTLVFVAVPQLGTPIAIPALLSGYGQQIGMGFILNATTAQHLAQNMPAAYSFIPSAAYFHTTTSPVIFDPSLKTISDLYQNYGPVISDATSLAKFLTATTNTKRSSPIVTPANSTLLAAATRLHVSLDSWQAPSGVNVITVAGVGIDTLSATRYYARPPSFWGNLWGASATIDMSPQMTSLGDNTVVTPSAAATIPKSFTYYIDLAAYNNKSGKNRGHADILEAEPTDELLIDIIRGSVGTAASLSPVLPHFVSTTIPANYLTNASNTKTEEQISVHSPVVLNVYDDQGRHTGPVKNITAIDSALIPTESKIPNSYYLPFGEGQYVGVPLGTKGKIVLSGTAAGSATLDITAYGTTTQFSDIPVMKTSIATVDLGSTTPSLDLDYDGDGTIDVVFPPTPAGATAYPAAVQKLISAFSRNRAHHKNMLGKLESIIETIKEKFDDHVVSSDHPDRAVPTTLDH